MAPIGQVAALAVSLILCGMCIVINHQARHHMLRSEAAADRAAAAAEQVHEAVNAAREQRIVQRLARQ